MDRELVLHFSCLWRPAYLAVGATEMGIREVAQRTYTAVCWRSVAHAKMAFNPYVYVSNLLLARNSCYFSFALLTYPLFAGVCAFLIIYYHCDCAKTFCNSHLCSELFLTFQKQLQCLKNCWELRPNCTYSYRYCNFLVIKIGGILDYGIEAVRMWKGYNLKMILSAVNGYR